MITPSPPLPPLCLLPSLPHFSRGGSRLLRQRSREIACYRGSIFHALVNCFVLTLCQSGVVTPARATRHPTATPLISGCFHRDWGGQEAVRRCVCVCVSCNLWGACQVCAPSIHRFLLGWDEAFILGRRRDLRVEITILTVAGLSLVVLMVCFYLKLVATKRSVCRIQCPTLSQSSCILWKLYDFTMIFSSLVNLHMIDAG